MGSYTNDPLLPAWYVPGWSAQNNSYPLNIPGIVSDDFNPFPTALDVITATGHFFSSPGGAPQGGYLLFTPSVNSLTYDNGTDPPSVIYSRATKAFLVAGKLSVELLATDNSNVNIPFTYHVKEVWLGGQEYDINVPKDSAANVDVHDLIVDLSVEPSNVTMIFVGETLKVTANADQAATVSASFYAPPKAPVTVPADRVADHTATLTWDSVRNQFVADVDTTGWIVGTWWVRTQVTDSNGTVWEYSEFILQS